MKKLYPRIRRDGQVVNEIDAATPAYLERLARGVAYEAGQVGGHGLEVEQRLEAALGDLGLVGGVGGVPGGVLHDIAQDHRRGVRSVVTLPDHLHGGLVLAGNGAQLRQGFLFGTGLKLITSGMMLYYIFVYL